jgi:hypothetical protein
MVTLHSVPGGRTCSLCRVVGEYGGQLDTAPLGCRVGATRAARIGGQVRRQEARSTDLRPIERARLAPLITSRCDRTSRSRSPFGRSPARSARANCSRTFAGAHLLVPVGATIEPNPRDRDTGAQRRAAGRPPSPSALRTASTPCSPCPHTRAGNRVLACAGGPSQSCAECGAKSRSILASSIWCCSSALI